MFPRKRFFKRRRKNRVLSYFRVSSLNFKQNFINIATKRGLKLKYANVISTAFQIFFFFFKGTTHSFMVFRIFLSELVFQQNIPIFFQLIFY